MHLFYVIYLQMINVICFIIHFSTLAILFEEVKKLNTCNFSLF